jgi:hypothetical protein
VLAIRLVERETGSLSSGKQLLLEVLISHKRFVYNKTCA